MIGDSGEEYGDPPLLEVSDGGVESSEESVNLETYDGEPVSLSSGSRHSSGGLSSTAIGLIATAELYSLPILWLKTAATVRGWPASRRRTAFGFGIAVLASSAATAGFILFLLRGLSDM